MSTEEYVMNVIRSLKRCPEEDAEEVETENISFFDDALELLISENDEIFEGFMIKHSYLDQKGFTIGDEPFKPFQVKLFLKLGPLQQKFPFAGPLWDSDEEEEKWNLKMRQWIIDFVSHPCFAEYSPSELVIIYETSSHQVEGVTEMLGENWHSPTSSFVMFTFASIKAGVYPWNFPTE